METLDAYLKDFFANHHLIATVLSTLAVVLGLGKAKGYYSKSGTISDNPLDKLK
jgi:hypothetical protein